MSGSGGSSSNNSSTLRAILLTALGCAVAYGVHKNRSLLFPGGNDDDPQQDGKAENEKGNGGVEASRTRHRATTLEDKTDEEGHLTVKPIGTVRSIYRLCVGTPRQGLLVPHSRGRIELDRIPADAADGLQDFSHVWVVFVFHLNTQSKRKSKVPSKIAPPALGGDKVGLLATRSPHRYNPIGLTLCKLDGIVRPTKHNKKTVLNVSGLDLVDGTPVLDIKPYVPHYDSRAEGELQLPPWVSGGLATKRDVRIENGALEQLEAILTEDPNALEFYKEETPEQTVHVVASCIVEMLSVDVRSSWQTKKARAGKFQAERAGRVQAVVDNTPTDNDEQTTQNDTKTDNQEQTPEELEVQQMCTQQLDNLLVHYSLVKPDTQSRPESEGSGAEDSVVVQSIELLSKPNLTVDTNPAAQTETAEEPIQDQKNIDKGVDEKTEGDGGVQGEQEGPTSVDTATIEATAPQPEQQQQQPEQQQVVEESPVDGPSQPEAEGIEADMKPRSSLEESYVAVGPVDDFTATTAALPGTLKNAPPTLKSTPKSVNPPKDADYGSLKSFWNKAAATNTPKGLNPEEVARKIDKKDFVFSDKETARREEPAIPNALVSTGSDGSLVQVPDEAATADDSGDGNAPTTDGQAANENKASK